MANLERAGVTGREAPPPSSDFEPVPPGEYVAVIDRDEEVVNQTGASRVVLTLKIAEGEHKGRRVWDSACLDGYSEKAINFGRDRLTAYCHAVGKPDAKDTAELLGIRFRAKIGQDEYNGKSKNTVQDVLGPAGEGSPETASSSKVDPAEIPF